MSAPVLQRLAEKFAGGPAAELRVRIFRLICLLTTVLCLGVVAPLNALQNLPWVVHGGNLLLGTVAGLCYWQSHRERHYIAFFLAVLVILLDVVWFYNAGSDGSVTHYFYPVMLFVIALFDGPRRRILALVLWGNVGLLFIAEHRFPGWVTPFRGREDRLVDLETGVLCSFMALGAVAWFILNNYRREQQRVSEMATRLAASEANYRGIFNSTSDALLVHTPEGRIVDVNEQAGVLFRAARTRMIGRTVAEFSLGEPPYGPEDAAEKMRQVLAAGPALFEWRSRREDGTIFWSEVALRACELQGERLIVAAVRDISRRKQAEETLRTNEARLRLAMEASRQGWFDLNLRTGETVSSPEYIRLLGYDPATFHSNLQAWVERIHPADRESALQAYTHGLRAGKIDGVEYRQQLKSGDWKWFRSVAQVVERDAAGNPLRVTGTHTDITERKELETQLLHSQRLEAVGTLASGVAHDLNNILTPMLMASGLLRDKLADARDRELMAMLDEGGRRGAAIVRQLLAFSRNLAQDRVPVDPRQLLREMAQLMRASFPKEIRIVEQYADVSGLIEVEMNQLHQVLMNLCVNARDAMPQGGTITLGLERAEVPATSGVDGGPHLVLSVSDTGHGIPPELIERIFDPFFTTKPIGKGTGLGLASVHGIVKAHRGFVRVESQPGQGTTFRVFLPAEEGTAVPVAPAATNTATAAETPEGAVLVVDDDPAVRLVTGRFLQRMGYRVVEAAGGREALAMLRDKREEIRLVVTDFSMPEMDGPTLAPQLREIKPGLRIIGVSGLNQDHRAAELKALGFAEVLAKPYELDDLLKAVKAQYPDALPK